MKQWEGVEANGLPTPQFNFLKRVVGFIVATITTDNIKVTASALAATPDTESFNEPVRIVNEELEALTERNRIPSLIREYTRNAAVDGDGCMYTYWDGEMETGQDAKGGIVTEVVENNRVFFGNPNDRRVQKQPWIIISARMSVRDAQIEAKANGISTWNAICSDEDNRQGDSAKRTLDNKVTVLTLLWRDEKTKEINCFRYSANSDIRKPWGLGIKLYPVSWLSWDYVQDCYHGQAMITGLIPNQIFVNKMWALSMLSMMKTSYPKYVYDKTRIAKLDNRVGGAIPINGGDVNSVIRTIDPAPISPQVSQLMTLAVTQTEESLGATQVALGGTRPDNAAAIIALQRAAATPTEMTKQSLYQSIEDLFRIYLEFMGEYYGVRNVDFPTPQNIADAYAMVGEKPPAEIPQPFDFKMLKEHPMTLKLDVGASSYYSEIASMQTLDNLLMGGHITISQYLERIPDGYIPGRRALISEISQMQAQQPMPTATPAEGGELLETGEKPEIPTGGGFGALQRKVVQTGTTEGIV